MLHEFLEANRAELVERCHEKVSKRSPDADQAGLQYGVTPFLEQLIRTLRLEQTDDPAKGLEVSGPASGAPVRSEMGDTAIAHGRELLARGYRIEEVVHDYGDLCQAITDLAFERGREVDTDEFRTLNRCLDNAIASAVAQFAEGGDPGLDGQRAEDSKHRLGAFAHEVRNLLNIATLAVRIIKSGHVGLTGATGQMLDRSLQGLSVATDNALAEVRLAAG